MIKPYGPHILIKVLEAEEQGFKISGEEADKPIRGEVVSIGKLEHNDIGIKVGSVIMYDYYSTVEYHQMDQEYLLVHEDSILGMEEETKDER